MCERDRPAIGPNSGQTGSVRGLRLSRIKMQGIGSEADANRVADAEPLRMIDQEPLVADIDTGFLARFRNRFFRLVTQQAAAGHEHCARH